MKEKILIITMILFVCFILAFSEFKKTSRVYDCGMAEWHPDIPTDVRNECRKLRYEHWKQQQEESKKKIMI
jgi:uncharacterized membrane protein